VLLTATAWLHNIVPFFMLVQQSGTSTVPLVRAGIAAFGAIAVTAIAAPRLLMRDPRDNRNVVKMVYVGAADQQDLGAGVAEAGIGPASVDQQMGKLGSDLDSAEPPHARGSDDSGSTTHPAAGGSGAAQALPGRRAARGRRASGLYSPASALHTGLKRLPGEAAFLGGHARTVRCAAAHSAPSTRHPAILARSGDAGCRSGCCAVAAPRSALPRRHTPAMKPCTQGGQQLARIVL
jgi:hypothetical protein